GSVGTSSIQNSYNRSAVRLSWVGCSCRSDAARNAFPVVWYNLPLSHRLRSSRLLCLVLRCRPCHRRHGSKFSGCVVLASSAVAFFPSTRPQKPNHRAGWVWSALRFHHRSRRSQPQVAGSAALESGAATVGGGELQYGHMGPGFSE